MNDEVTETKELIQMKRGKNNIENKYTSRLA